MADRRRVAIEWIEHVEVVVGGFADGPRPVPIDELADAVREHDIGIGESPTLALLDEIRSLRARALELQQDRDDLAGQAERLASDLHDAAEERDRAVRLRAAADEAADVERRKREEVEAGAAAMRAILEPLAQPACYWCPECAVEVIATYEERCPNCGFDLLAVPEPHVVADALKSDAGRPILDELRSLRAERDETRALAAGCGWTPDRDESAAEWLAREKALSEARIGTAEVERDNAHKVGLDWFGFALAVSEALGIGIIVPKDAFVEAAKAIVSERNTLRARVAEVEAERDAEKARAGEAEARLLGLRDLHMTPGGLDMEMTGEMCTAFARTTGAYMAAMLAPNYAEVRLECGGPSGSYILTIQRAGGKSPGQLHREARDALAAATERADRAEADLAAAREALGDDRPSLADAARNFRIELDGVREREARALRRVRGLEATVGMATEFRLGPGVALLRAGHPVDPGPWCLRTRLGLGYGSVGLLLGLAERAHGADPAKVATLRRALGGSDAT